MMSAENRILWDGRTCFSTNFYDYIYYCDVFEEEIDLYVSI